MKFYQFKIQKLDNTVGAVQNLADQGYLFIISIIETIKLKTRKVIDQAKNLFIRFKDDSQSNSYINIKNNKRIKKN